MKEITEEDPNNATLMKLHTNLLKAAEEALVITKVNNSGGHTGVERSHTRNTKQPVTG